MCVLAVCGVCAFGNAMGKVAALFCGSAPAAGGSGFGYPTGEQARRTIYKFFVLFLTIFDCCCS